MLMFDVWGKELKYAKELLLNHYRKLVRNLWGCRICV